MDPLTHTLAGAALSETGLGRRTRFGAAAIIVGANLPDIDALSYLGGQDAGYAFRRGWTHGVLAVLVLPVLLALVLLLWDRLRPQPAGHGPPAAPAWLFALSAIGVSSHPALDWLNTYGVRLLMPFDDRWFYGDAVFIVDPWLWLGLGGAVFLPRSRSVASCAGWAALALGMSLVVLGVGRFVPLGARIAWVAGLAALVSLRRLGIGAGHARRATRIALGVTGLYVALMIGAATIAPAKVTGALERSGVTGIERIMVGPLPANPLRRDFVAETATGYRFGVQPRPWSAAIELAPRVLPLPASDAVVEAARGAPGIRGVLAWMRFPVAIVEPAPEGYEVVFIDARYMRGRPLRSGFGTATVRLGLDLRPR